MLMRKAFLILLILLNCGISKINAQKKNVYTKKIVVALDTFRKRFMPEKIYVHSDKNYYTIGDTIWLKAYVLEKESYGYSKKSGLLYIELNDDSLDNVKRVSMPIRYGVGWAQIPILTKQFHEGRYNLRAYTNWMKNGSVNSFFNHSIYIAKPAYETWRIRTSVMPVAEESASGNQVRIGLYNADQKPIALHNIQVRITGNNELINRIDLQTDEKGETVINFDPKDDRFRKPLGLEVLNTQKGSRPQILKVPLNLGRKSMIDLQFLPEGGNLVAGLLSKLAFKAVSESGFGIDIAGSIFDNKGNEVTKFSSVHKGMGTVDFMPVAGEKYTAKIQGSENVYGLPKIWESGSQLSIKNLERSDSVTINVHFSQNYSVRENEGLYLIGQSRGFPIYSKKIVAENQTFAVPKNLFPSGITHFTLLRDTIPLNERIVFIDHEDNLKISINKDEITEDDSTRLAINVKDFDGKLVSGSFSMAITNDDLVAVDSAGNDGIITNLLLTSEIKGYVESPSYYLNHLHPDNWTHLDNLLLTQGWIGIDWKAVFSSNLPKFKAEEHFELSGKVVNAFGKPMEATQIIISSQRPAFINEIKTDKNGRFNFSELPLLDTAAFFILANTPRGKTLNFGELTLDKFIPAEIYPSKTPLTMPWYATNDKVIQQAIQYDLKRQGPLVSQSGINLEEVIVKGKKTIPGSYNSRGADMVLNKNDIKASGASNLYDLLRSQFPGLKVTMLGGFPTLMYGKYAMHIIINGTSLPLVVSYKPSVQEVVEGLKDYPISSFVGVELQYSRKYNKIGPSSMSLPNPAGPQTSNMERLNGKKVDDGFIADGPDASYTAWRVGNLQNRDFDIGLIFLTTEANSFNYKKSNSSIYRPVYTVYPKRFYTSRFDVGTQQQDHYNGPTLFWEPDIVTDNSGRAIVSFLTPQKKGRYSIILQGADLMGNIGFTAKKLPSK